jgi:phosphatidylglycerol:prolipoprotein diacylglycerol transferase
MTLFKIFGFSVHGYGLMLAIAFLVGIIGVGKLAKKLGISFDTVVDLAIWIIVGAVLGARAAYVITEYHYFLTVPWWQIFWVGSGGLAFHGGLIGGFIAGLLFIRSKKIYPWKLADIVAPFIALGYSIVRIGCFMNGCCYGKVSNLPWALRCAAGDSLLRHPTQFYSMIGSFILFLILFRQRNHRHFSGYLFLLYIGLYSILRFVVEIFRESPVFLPWLSLAQLVCIILASLAFGLIWFFGHRERRRSANTDAAPEAHH